MISELSQGYSLYDKSTDLISLQCFLRTFITIPIGLPSLKCIFSFVHYFFWPYAIFHNLISRNQKLFSPYYWNYFKAYSLWPTRIHQKFSTYSIDYKIMIIHGCIQISIMALKVVHLSNQNKLSSYLPLIFIGGHKIFKSWNTIFTIDRILIGLFAIIFLTKYCKSYLWSTVVSKLS